jgi:hypothetical protein
MNSNSEYWKNNDLGETFVSIINKLIFQNRKIKLLKQMMI